MWSITSQKVYTGSEISINFFTLFGFSVGNVGKGIQLGSSPSADTAVKIAQVLGVSVEYLVNGTNKSTEKNQENEELQLKLYRKYHDLITKCEKLPPEQVQLLSQVADKLEK